MAGTTAKIIMDSVGVAKARITTFEVTCPRIILAEIGTHRIVTKSAASSRAIPVSKRIEMVENDPWIPKSFGKNKRGMSSDEELDDSTAAEARGEWMYAIRNALCHARAMEKFGLHKQFANRILETYSYVTVALTATDWDNYFWLRRGPDAQPEFKELADAMWEAYEDSIPVKRVNHLPYTEGVDMTLPLDTLAMISSARCARTSYKTFDNKVSTVKDDLDLCKKLTDQAHLSPFDHPAIADFVSYDHTREGWFWANPADARQYWGWRPYRVWVEKKLGLKLKKNPYDMIDPSLILDE